jgi:hypothetical protein
MSRVKISSTDFVDFINKKGTRKITKVKEVNNRGEYNPAFDFYRGLRNQIIDTLKYNRESVNITDYVNELNDSKKRANYDNVSKGFLKFLKKNNYSWVNPNQGLYEISELSINVNPEVGLSIKGELYLVKLYFKDDNLGKEEAQVFLNLMQQTLCDGIFKDYKCALLDLRKGKLHKHNHKEFIEDLFMAEAETFISLWKGINRKSA